MRISDVADSTLKLMRRDAGSDSQIGETHSFQGEFGEWYDLGLCWDGEEAIGTLDGRPYTVFGDYELEGTRGGVGGIPNTPMEFDDFLFSKHDVDDPACPSCGADRGDRETQCRWSDHSDEPLPTVFMTIRCLGPRCSICDSGLTSSPIVDVPLLPIGSVSGFMAWRSVGGFWGLQCYTGPSIEGPDNGFLLLYNFGARFVQLPGNVASLNPFNLSHVLRSIPCNGLSLNHSHYGLVLWQDFCRGGLVDCTDPETQFVQRFLVEVNE
jgi:hypothetical protein